MEKNGVVEWETAEAGQKYGTDADLKILKVAIPNTSSNWTMVSGNSPKRVVIGSAKLEKISLLSQSPE